MWLLGRVGRGVGPLETLPRRIEARIRDCALVVAPCMLLLLLLHMRVLYVRRRRLHIVLLVVWLAAAARRCVAGASCSRPGPGLRCSRGSAAVWSCRCPWLLGLRPLLLWLRLWLCLWLRLGLPVAWACVRYSLGILL